MNYITKICIINFLGKINSFLEEKENNFRPKNRLPSLNVESTRRNFCLLETCSKNLEQLNGIKITPKEIDVISCIVSGRASAKTIASFLVMSPKTAEVHIRNIKLKLECPSREGIVRFIEKSGKFSAARRHYLFLCLQFAFEQTLQKLSISVAPTNLTCLIVYEKQYELFIERLRHPFKSLGVKGIFRVQETESCFHQSLQVLDSPSVDHFLFVVSSRPLKQLLMKNLRLQNLNTVTFISLGDQLEQEPSQEKRDLPSIASIHFENSVRDYLSFFDLFKRLFPEVALDKLMSEFKEYYDISLNETSGKVSLSADLERNDLKKKDQTLLPSFTKPKGKLFINTILCLNLFCTLIFALKSERLDQSYQTPFISQKQEIKKIRSELPLPHENVLLKHPEIIKSIEKALKGGTGIQTLALIGIGGAGKTTMARYYAQAHKAQIIWEINAETQESLMVSFESLSYALAETEKEKKTLRELQEVRNFEERREKLLFFVKEKLKSSSNWFLIFDNVEKFSDIQHYFPADPTVWGKGKIVVTTRDSNIANNNYINHAFHIEGLSEKEKLDLFMKILNHRDTAPWSSARKEQAQKFVEKLPPFPLDVSAAAHYLNVTNISYQKYLEHLRHCDKAFENIQKSILKEAEAYNKTRYSIITLSLKQIMQEDNYFKDLLFLVSLIDSQNIPKDLLNTCKDNVVVDHFIYQLKKYSLITRNDQVSNISSSLFAIHRNIQEIILFFFINELNSEQKDKLMQPVFNILDNYIKSIIDKHDFLKMQILMRHYEKILNYSDLLNNVFINYVKGELGGIYFYLGYYIKAQKILEESIKALKGHSIKNYNKIAKLLIYLAMVYRELGNCEKSIDLLNKSISIYKENFPNSHIEITQVLAQLGISYRHLGNYEKSIDFLEKSILIYEKYLPKDPRFPWAIALLGNVYREIGNYEKSKDLLEKSLLFYKKYFPENSVRLAWVLGYLGNVYRETGFGEKSRILLEESLLNYKKYLPETHIEVVRTLTLLGNTYRELGKYKEAEILLKKSLLIHKKFFPENYSDYVRVLRYLGNYYKELRYYEKSKNLLKESLILSKKNYGEHHIESAKSLYLLGQVYFLESHLEIAEKLETSKNQQILRHGERIQELISIFRFFFRLYRPISVEDLRE